MVMVLMPMLLCFGFHVQVAKAAFDGSTRKWVLEGAVRTPMNVMADLKQQPPIKPWNLGVYDALVLADKMTGCPGGLVMIMVCDQYLCLATT